MAGYRDCLASVFKSTYSNFSVIVVDNDSGNDSLMHLKNWLVNTDESRQVQFILLSRSDTNKLTNPATLPKLALMQNDTNAGFAGGNNIAFKLLRTGRLFLAIKSRHDYPGKYIRRIGKVCRSAIVACYHGWRDPVLCRQP